MYMEPTPMEYTSTGVAATAVSSPVWLPWLHNVSEAAAEVTPVLGGIWLLIQIVSFAVKRIKGK